MAEKPSVAKAITEHLSQGKYTKFMGASKYNPVYEFAYTMNNQKTTYRVTSVLGHVKQIAYPSQCADW